MIRVPTETLRAYSSLLASRNTPKSLYFHYQKWLRYYLDYCHKYPCPAHEPDRLGQFMHKLHEKHQTIEQQKQAADAIAIYLEMLESGSPPKPTPSPSHHRSTQPVERSPSMPGPKNPWDTLYDRLREEIKVRQGAKGVSPRISVLWF